LSFKTNPVVLDALEQAFLLAFKNVKPTNKRYCVALDVSGSMGSPMSGSVLSCRDASIAMSMSVLRTEPVVECVAFSDGLTALPVTTSTTFKEFHDKIYNLSFSSTDCSLPLTWATENKKEFDCFIIYTDNETWFGDIHPFEALKKYREASGIPAKLIVVAFSATKFSIADPTDPGMMDISGFDSATPELISQFVLGNV
jgi:60 kDa SS-A/Ro ribonucleoprotein